MKSVRVTYRVKPDCVAENEALIVKVYEQLKAEGPAGFHYVTYKLDDGVTFVHLATVDGEENPLFALSAFKAFSSTVKDRAEGAPVTTTMTRVGAYEPHL